ncbi:hypothetical protein F5984_04890 [Rudanella paleaurantiibacter]|uniref:Beta-lactamase class A catalytic domain-containing protein n=1 Tax=Rudanella paleaurantiibacter TaxID=2614655 RepID=A0A7J5U1L9_9BACT|nr:serine hydrolase [Rudanella paleaurantiibacter]KAB7731576.1 hypothetical protein F5984_04890 [Rudanella paleaurantiibacter]
MSSLLTRFLLVLIASLSTLTGYSQARTDAFLRDLILKNPHPVVQSVMRQPETHRLQIIYTQIDRDRANKPTFTHYTFRVDSLEYFNPASTVKLPLALLALEKINRLNIPGLTRETAMQFDSAYARQTRLRTDSTAQLGYPSVAHLIKKTLLVSENEPYNRLYEFVGQQAINRSLWAQGYTDTRITHRFVRMSADENRHTNPVQFLSPTGRVIYSQPAAYNPDSIRAGRRDTLGRGYLDANDSLVTKPFDFSSRNKLSLRSLQQILQATLFPESVPARQRFGLKPDDYRFMYQYLSQFPGETNYPKYDAETFYDSYAKFFFMDSLHHQLPEGVRVFNKVGWAYGFMTDVSYVADFTNKVEFMLTATIYVNRDGILNDNRYEYDAIGIPFMYQLGQTIYTYERQRTRTHQPNLDQFRIRYETRLPDSRPVIKAVDN